MQGVSEDKGEVVRTHDVIDEGSEPCLTDVEVHKHYEYPQLRREDPSLLQLALEVDPVLGEYLDEVEYS